LLSLLYHLTLQGEKHDDGKYQHQFVQVQDHTFVRHVLLLYCWVQNQELSHPVSNHTDCHFKFQNRSWDAKGIGGQQVIT
jgi:hypothetical protein